MVLFWYMYQQVSKIGEKLRLSKRGYMLDNLTRGDLYAEVKIMVPKEVSKEEKLLLEKLSNISTYNPRNIEK